MKMIYVGSLATKPDRDSHWITSFESLGYRVMPFSTASKISTSNPGIEEKIFRRLNIGLENKKIQQSLIQLANSELPKWIHFRLPIEFDRRTIKLLKSKNILLTQYFNDDPFSKRGPIGLHWKFRKALPFYDAHFVYRSKNIQEYIRAGACYVEHCPPAYDPLRHFINNNWSFGRANYIGDAAFIGHWENDWRAECLSKLIERGYKVIIRGGMWDRATSYFDDNSISKMTPVFGAEYNFIYSNVVAGICFFSKINNDNWTERALEIVAVGGLLVCERSNEAQTYFRDREEAFFFSSIHELVEVLQFLINNPEERERVRVAGFLRLQRSKNTILDRATQVHVFVDNRLHTK